MNPYDPPEDMTDEGSYACWVEDSSVLINREFTRVTTDALSDPQPTVHRMQLKVLEYEAKHLNLWHEGRVDFPILDKDTGGLRMLEAKISLTEEAYRVGDHALALDISTDVNLRLALWDVDTESLSPLMKAADRRSRGQAKRHNSTSIRLLGGPYPPATVQSWDADPRTITILLDYRAEGVPGRPRLKVIYRRTDETTKEGHVIYRYDETTHK
jgi:hypothetical protein